METKTFGRSKGNCKESFDPTYKGWKLYEIKYRIPTYRYRFDPTYKGWKLEYIEHIGKENLRFDPTYKGWKQIYNSRLYISTFGL